MPPDGTVFVRLRRRGQQDPDRLRIFLRQVAAQRGGDVQAAAGERQRPVTCEHVAQEIVVRELRVHRPDHHRDGARRTFAELVLELVRQCAPAELRGSC